jgi:hypothetical protein
MHFDQLLAVDSGNIMQSLEVKLSKFQVHLDDPDLQELGWTTLPLSRIHFAEVYSRLRHRVRSRTVILQSQRHFQQQSGNSSPLVSLSESYSEWLPIWRWFLSWDFRHWWTLHWEMGALTGFASAAWEGGSECLCRIDRREHLFIYTLLIFRVFLRTTRWFASEWINFISRFGCILWVHFAWSPGYRALLKQIQIWFVSEIYSSLFGNYFEIPSEFIWHKTSERIAFSPLDLQVILKFPKNFTEFLGKRFLLLWRRSCNSFNVVDFHSRCDAYMNTLTLILDMDGNIIGGLTQGGCNCFNT